MDLADDTNISNYFSNILGDIICPCLFSSLGTIICESSSQLLQIEIYVECKEFDRRFVIIIEKEILPGVYYFHPWSTNTVYNEKKKFYGG